ncbi:MAG: hypothetical protein ACXVB0_15925 [Mucilaginibacter sp.]
MKTDPLFNKLFVCVIVPLTACIMSCNLQGKLDKINVDSASKAAGNNFVVGATQQVPALTQKILQSLKVAQDTLNPDLQKIYKVIDSLGTLSNAQLTKLADNLHQQITRLKGDVKDTTLKTFLIKTLESMTGKLQNDTKVLLNNVIQSTLDSLKAPSTKAKMDTIISHLLDENTQSKTQLLISRSLQPTIDSLTNRVDKMIKGDIPFVKREAYGLLAGLGIVAIAIIAFVWYERSKYARLVKILTYHINKIPNKDVYDDLTSQIQDHTQKESLEPLLRNTLQKQGIN